MNQIYESQAKPSAIKFGLLYGLLLIVGFVLVYFLKIDAQQNPAIGRFLSICSYFIFPILLIYFGIQHFKKNNTNLISFSNCLKIGVSIAFVGAVLFAIFTTIFSKSFPEYEKEILQQTKQIILQQNPKTTALELQNQIDLSRKFSSPFLSIPFTILLFSFLGLVYAVIIGLLVRNQQNKLN